MKRKVRIFTVLFLVLMLGAACGKDDKTSDNTTKQEQENDKEKAKETPKAEAEDKVADTLADMETYLLQKGILHGERGEVSASMIGAADGFKYPEAGIEVYEYDMASDSYKKLVAGESVEIEGMEGFSVTADAVNNKYVLIYSGEGEAGQDVLDAFSGFGTK